MVKKVLVPLDGSATSERALEPALNLARPQRAQLILLHSMIPVHTMLPVFADEYAWVWPEGSRDVSRRQASEYLTSVAQRQAEAGVEVRTLLVEGDEAVAILDAAAEESVDLIVMSAFGYSGMTRWSMGSITEKVLHSAPCPVFVVRSAKPIHNILITLDGSELAEKAMEPALELACALDARVTLLRVTRPPFRPDQIPYLQWVEDDLGEQLGTNLRNGAETYLRDVALRHQGTRPGGEPLGTVVRQGPPVEEILDYANSHMIDLIALSTHGRTGLRRWIYGSIAARVLRGSACNVLIVRPPAEELK